MKIYYIMIRKVVVMWLYICQNSLNYTCKIDVNKLYLNKTDLKNRANALIEG